MKFRPRPALGIILICTGFLVAGVGFAQEPPANDSPAGEKPEPKKTIPELADIIPLETQLSGRFAALRNRLAGGLDVGTLEKGYTEAEEKIEDLTEQLNQWKYQKSYSYTTLVQLRQAIKKEHETFRKLTKPLRTAIQELEEARQAWLEEKRQWEEWKAAILDEAKLEQLTSTFTQANQTIQAALDLIVPQLEALLKSQVRASTTQARIQALAAEVDRLIAQERNEGLVSASPPMFSSAFVSQFNNALWYRFQQGLTSMSWPDRRFADQQGWVAVLQLLFTVVVLITISRNIHALMESQRWRFLAERPVAAAIFLGIMATLFLYDYRGMPAGWKLGHMIAGGLAFARLAGALVDHAWQRQLVYGLMILLMVTEFLFAINLPLPLFRIYVVLAGAAGLAFCTMWSKVCARTETRSTHVWGLRVAAAFFGLIAISEIWGKEGTSQYLFLSALNTVTLILPFVLLMYMLHGGLKWLLLRPFVTMAPEPAEQIGVVIHRITLLFDALICIFLAGGILFNWRVYDSLEGAIWGLLSLGFTVGSLRISLGAVIVAAAIVYGALVASQLLRTLLIDQALAKRRVDRGTILSVGALFHYILIFVAFLISLLVIGFDLTKITIMLSALGVGIGFGLQNIVNNFICGLILLFERPVRVGDYIEIGGAWAEIRNIGLRATTVQTFDYAELIIPNADLITNTVTNWTLSSRLVRVIIPVGVAYGSDVDLVIETLVACADGNSKVTKVPAPQALFLNFGESALDFELRAWVWDADEVIRVKSELHQAIDRSFREAGIEIAFPQRDLHLRSVPESLNPSGGECAS